MFKFKVKQKIYYFIFQINIYDFEEESNEEKNLLPLENKLENRQISYLWH